MLLSGLLHPLTRRRLFCKQDNWWTQKWTSTKFGTDRQGMTLYKWLTFGDDSDPHVESTSLFHFLDHCGIEEFRTYVSISHTINGQFVPYLAKWLDADKIMHDPRHFGTDPTDIQIRINMKIRIHIPDHFCFKFWCWQRFALSECSCIMFASVGYVPLLH